MIAPLSTSSVNVGPLESVLDAPGLIARIKGDLTFLHVIFEAFRCQYPEQRSEMKSAFAGNDLGRVRTVAHSLKGNASTLGGHRVAAAAAEVIAACGDSGSALLPELFRRLDLEVCQFQQAMMQLIKK